MRTNIVIDDDLMAEGMHVTGIKTKRDVVEEALRVLVRTTQQKNVLALRGGVQWEGDLDAMREGRYFHESKAEYVVNAPGSGMDDPATNEGNA